MSVKRLVAANRENLLLVPSDMARNYLECSRISAWRCFLFETGTGEYCRLEPRMLEKFSNINHMSLDSFNNSKSILPVKIVASFKYR
jgi:hypothetical protein